jgi:hypothetical protein
VNRASTLYFNPGYGSLSINRPAGTHGGYVMTHDSGDNEFNMIGYNGTNFWIGKGQRATSAHIGETYISTGYNTTTGTGNPSIFVAVPNDTNTNDSCYPLLHQGNTYFQTSSNAATWEALGITKSGYAFYVFRGDTANKTPPYCAGYYAPGLLFGYGDTKGFISTSYNEAKISFGGGQRTSSDPATKAPTWYFTLSGTTATTYNLDNFALASDYLPLAGGTMDSGATVTVYTDQSETQGIQYTSTGQRFKIASGVGWARSVMAYKGAFSGDILGAYGMFGTSDSFTNNRMSYFYIGKSYNDQWYEFAYGKHTIADNDLNGWMLRYRYPWTASGTSGTYEGSFISLYPYDRYGYCLCVGENSGGLTIVGAGEAAQQLRITVTDASATPYGNAISYGTESLILGADTDLYFVSGANSLTSTAHEEGTNLKTFIWSNAGTLRPWNDDMYSIGAATKRWNYGYFTNISGKLIGTIDGTTTGVTQDVKPHNADSSTKIATTSFAWNLKHRSGWFYNSNSAYTTNCWAKVAEFVTTSSNTYRATTFIVSANYTSYTGIGILYIALNANGATGVINGSKVKWLVTDGYIQNEICVTTSVSTTAPTHVTFQIWARCKNARYQSISVAPIYEAGLNGYSLNSGWEVISNTGDDAKTAYTGTALTIEYADILHPEITNPSSATTYSIPFMTYGTTDHTGLFPRKNDGLKYRTVEGTASSNGYGLIELGNDIPSGTAGNKRGYCRIYGQGAYHSQILSSAASSNKSVYLPNEAGNIMIRASSGQSLLYEASSSSTTSAQCSVTNLFTNWKVVYVCIQNSAWTSSNTNATNYNFLVPLEYVKSKSNYNSAISSSNPGYYVGEGYNPSNTGTSSATRMLVQWKDDSTIVFTHASGAKVGIIRIYGIY